MHFLEFVVVLSGAYATPVRGPCHVFRGEVDDELHIPLDDVVGVAFGAYGDITHGRVRANRPRPCDSQNVISSGVLPQLTSTAGSG